MTYPHGPSSWSGCAPRSFLQPRPHLRSERRATRPKRTTIAARFRKRCGSISSGNWNEAFALFEAAHALQPNARTLRGMGITLYENRRYVEATRQLRAALADKRNPLTDELRRSTQEVLTRSEQFAGAGAAERFAAGRSDHRGRNARRAGGCGRAAPRPR